MVSSKLQRAPSLALLCAALVAGLSVNIGGDYISLAAGVLVTLWGLYRPLKFRIDAVFTISVLLIIWATVSLAWTESREAPRALLSQFVIVIVFLVMRDLIRNQRDLRIVANGFLLGIVLSVVRMVIGGAPTNEYGDISRVTLEAFNANYLGYAYAGAVAVNVAIFWCTPKRTRWFRWFSTAVSIAGMLLTDTRGAQVAVLLLVVWLLISKISSAPPIRTLIAVVIFASLAMSLGLVDQVLKRLDFGDRSTGDLSGRFGLWRAARDIWYNHFFIGEGILGTTTSQSLGFDAHNIMLETAANAGLIGLVLMLAHFIVSLKPLAGTTLNNQGKLILGSYLVASVPIYLSGAWGWALTAWVVLAIFSRAVQLSCSAIDGVTSSDVLASAMPSPQSLEPK